MKKIFWGGGTAPLQTPPPVGRGTPPSPTYPLGASILAPSAVISPPFCFQKSTGAYQYENLKWHPGFEIWYINHMVLSPSNTAAVLRRWTKPSCYCQLENWNEYEDFVAEVLVRCPHNSINAVMLLSCVHYPLPVSYYQLVLFYSVSHCGFVCCVCPSPRMVQFTLGKDQKCSQFWGVCLLCLVLHISLFEFVFIGWLTLLMKTIQTTTSRAGDSTSTPTHCVEDLM